MSRFIEGENRHQCTLLPELLDDYIAQDNSVRVIEAFVDELDLFGLGFTKVQPKQTGRPAYHPSSLLKIYIYGYLNRVQSSRRLERETQRNLELMWLTGRLSPDFKTIADFRKDNGHAIKAVCRQFVMICRNINLFSESMIAIDGSKFKAVNNRDRNYTRAKIKRRIAAIDKSLNRYLAQLDGFDLQEQAVEPAKMQHINKQLASLKQQMADAKKMEQLVEESPGHQVSLTDPDARAMGTTARSSGVVGYNVQTAVDTKHLLIVEHDVTNKTSDRGQLSRMAIKARDAIGVDKLDVIADRGYFNSEEIKVTVDAGITPYVPKSMTSGNIAKGLFDRRDFIYIAEDDEYRCPAGERLPNRMTTVEKGKKMIRYWSSNCQTCKLKSKCTPSKQRRVTRWEHEAVLEMVQQNMNRKPTMMQTRKQTVEHPYGTIKSWMGAMHFQTRGLNRVATEMSLHVLAYNLRRMINIFGVEPLMKIVRA